MNRMDHSQRTMLHYACHENSTGHHLIATLILRKFPNIDTTIRDTYGCTAMEYAFQCSDFTIVDILVSKQGNYGELLLIACKLPSKRYFKEVIDTIRNKCSDQYVSDIKDVSGRTPLHVICEHSPTSVHGRYYSDMLKVGQANYVNLQKRAGQ